jgi:hypothetical protein
VYNLSEILYFTQKIQKIKEKINMLDLERFCFETFLRIKQYGIDSSADFPASTKGGINFISLNQVITDAENADASQVGLILK